MSNQITTARVQQYSANVFMLVQQQGSKLRGLVRHERQKAKRAFYDSIGEVEAVEKTGRHSDTPQIDTPHGRRAVTMKDYHWADMIDDQDKIRMLHDPKSYYAKAAAWAFGRKQDDIIIAVVSGTSYSGEEADTAVAFPSTRQIAAVSGSALSNMNVDALRLAKYYFDKEDVMDTIVMAVGARQVYAMLGEEELTSADYAAIKALVRGEINSFMGFTFIMTNRLTTPTAAEMAALKFSLTTGEFDSSAGTALSGTVRRCIAWAKENIILATGMGVETKVTERADKSYATQVYVRMTLGGTRLEEEKALEIYCTE